jgi:outer membrane receptor protein involved in Fe transport
MTFVVLLKVGLKRKFFARHVENAAIRVSKGLFPMRFGMHVSARDVRTFTAFLALAVITFSGLGTRVAFAQSDVGTVQGVVTSTDGADVADAVVTLSGRGADRTVRSGTDGRFELDNVPAGTYGVRAEATRYDRLSGRTIDVRGAAVTEIALSLARSSSSLATIGHVAIQGNDALSTSSAPTSYLDPQAYSNFGYTRLSDMLQNSISTTLVHPLGGSTVLPTSVALRGPDPTETLVDIDGHQVNSGNTGDFDLSLLDPADYVGVELVKGIAPSSLVGPDTIDGAINIRTLEPTTEPHGVARVSFGSFDALAETLEYTGTDGRLGYALSLHRTTTDGETNQTVLDVTNPDDPSVAHVGSGVDASTALAKLRYAFGRGDGYAEFSFHDQSAQRDLSAALSSIPDGGADPVTGPLQALDAFEGTSLDTHNVGYGFDVSTPIGGRNSSGVAQTNLLFRHYTSVVNASVFGPGADTSPYLYSNRDRVDDDTIELDHHFYNSDLTLQYGVRNEGLVTDFVAGQVVDESYLRRVPTDSVAVRSLDDDGGDDTSPTTTLGLGQTQRSAVLRYSYDPGARIHLTAAAYYSRYSTFGSSVDPRFGAVYTPDARTALRASVGTTYQTPQLPELYVPPTLPAAVGGYISVGNPNLQPDRATEFGFGIDHVFELGPYRTAVTLDLYRVNLRNPSTPYVPPPNPNCDASSTNPANLCPLTYQVNTSDARYQGFEASAMRQIAPYTTVYAGYAVRSAYVFAAPTYLGYLLAPSISLGEQAQGLPLQKGILSIQKSPRFGFTYGGGLVYEGPYNELDQPQYATLDANLGYRWRDYEIAVSGTNLTDVYDQRFTAQGAGSLYGSPQGLEASDAYVLQGTAFNVSLTRRF